jgi:hypothetical protein
VPPVPALAAWYLRASKPFTSVTGGHFCTQTKGDVSVSVGRKVIKPPKSYAPSPRPYTLYPKPQTLYLISHILNPKP